MFLSKIELDRRNPSVRQALKNCNDMHRNLMGFFEMPRKEAGVLYRLHLTDFSASVYLLSDSLLKPRSNATGMSLVGSKLIDGFLQSLTEGEIFNFDLLTLPSKKKPVEGQKNSRRIALRSAGERADWLRGKAAQYGFEIIWSREDGMYKQFGKSGKDEMYLTAIQFRGMLRITDTALFTKAYTCGIGPAKSYGLGMLLLSKP